MNTDDESSDLSVSLDDRQQTPKDFHPSADLSQVQFESGDSQNSLITGEFLVPDHHQSSSMST